MFEVGLSRQRMDSGWAVYDIMAQSSQRGRGVIQRQSEKAVRREWASRSWSPGLGRTWEPLGVLSSLLCK